MQQSFFESKRRDVAVVFGMSERLVDEENLHTFGTKVSMDRLQTGDISNKGGSGQAAEDQDRVTAPQAGC